MLPLVFAAGVDPPPVKARSRRRLRGHAIGLPLVSWVCGILEVQS